MGPSTNLFNLLTIKSDDVWPQKNTDFCLTLRQLLATLQTNRKHSHTFPPKGEQNEKGQNTYGTACMIYVFLPEGRAALPPSRPAYDADEGGQNTAMGQGAAAAAAANRSLLRWPVGEPHC